MVETAVSFQFDDPIIFGNSLSVTFRGGEETLMLAVLQEAVATACVVGNGAKFRKDAGTLCIVKLEHGGPVQSNSHRNSLSK